MRGPFGCMQCGVQAGYLYCSTACSMTYNCMTAYGESRATARRSTPKKSSHLNCSHCGVVFYNYDGFSSRKYCSANCCNASQKLEWSVISKVPRKRKRPDRFCTVCGDVLSRYRRTFCSDTCAQYKAPREEKQCPMCLEGFVPHSYQVYCSNRCRNKFHDRRRTLKKRLQLKQRRLAARIVRSLGVQIDDNRLAYSIVKQLGINIGDYNVTRH